MVSPGSFRNAGPDELPKGERSVIEAPKVERSDDLIASYRLFKEEVHSPRSVLYPSCGYDESPALAFDNVTFVDMEDGNGGCIDLLVRAGHNAIKQDIRTYSPVDKFDLLILQNSNTQPEWSAKHLCLGGYIIANDSRSDATKLYQRQNDFSLIGTIICSKKDDEGSYTAKISFDLTDLFVPVNSFQEFKLFRPDDYERMVKDPSLKDIGLQSDIPKISFAQAWGIHTNNVGLSLPYRRVADQYIFRKIC